MTAHLMRVEFHWGRAWVVYFDSKRVYRGTRDQSRQTVVAGAAKKFGVKVDKVVRYRGTTSPAEMAMQIVSHKEEKPTDA